MSEIMHKNKKPLPPTAPVARRGRLLSTFAADRRGNVIILFALLLPLVVSGIGFGVEVAYWFNQKRSLQTAADAAAVAGSYEIAENRAASVGTVTAREAAGNGWSDANGTITVRSYAYNAVYPASGSYIAEQKAVEVELTRNENLLFAGWFMSGPVTINARAVGLAISGVNDTCLLSLGASNSAKALWISGTATVALNSCAVASNSTDSAGIETTSGLSADCVYSAGGVSGTPTTTGCSGPRTNQVAVADPYEAIVTKPLDSDFADCAVNGGDYSLSGAGSMDTIYDTDGPFCSITVNVVNGTLTMEPGTYYIDRGDLKILGSDVASIGTINALGGVTIVFGDSTGGGDCGGLVIGGSTSLNIAAPTSGDFSGIAVYRSSECDSGAGYTFGGSNDSAITGALYNPSGAVYLTGNGEIGGACMQVIADTVKMTGTISIGNDCDTAGTATIVAGSRGGLVE